MSDQLQLRHWQQIKQAQALEYAGTPEGNAALIESRRYGLAADRVEEAQRIICDLAVQVEVMRDALCPFASFAEHYPMDAKYGNRPRSGTVYGVASHEIGENELTVEDFHAAKHALSLPNTAAILRQRDARTARTIATDWLPNMRCCKFESSLNKTVHNLAVADCVKHVLSFADELGRKNG